MLDNFPEICYGFGGMDDVKIMNFYKKAWVPIFFRLRQAGLGTCQRSRSQETWATRLYEFTSTNQNLPFSKGKNTRFRWGAFLCHGVLKKKSLPKKIPRDFFGEIFMGKKHRGFWLHDLIWLQLQRSKPRQVIGRAKTPWEHGTSLGVRALQLYQIWISVCP